MSLTLVTPPVANAEVVSLEDAKAQCSLYGVSAYDSYLQEILIPAAVERAESATLRQLRTATYRLLLSDLPSEGWIELPRPPLVSVSGVTYVDGSGVTQAWASSNYLVDTPGDGRGRLSLAYGASWPTIRSQMNAVAITFVAGYGTAPAEMPALLRMAILMDIATLFAQRQNLVTGLSLAAIPEGSADIYRRFRSYACQTAVCA